MPWSPWYEKVRIEANKGKRWFCSEAEALGGRLAAGRRALSLCLQSRYNLTLPEGRLVNVRATAERLKSVSRSGPRVLVKIIKRHPWSSLRDALLIAGFMTFAVMLARRYDLFAFLDDLADPRRGISPAEGVLFGVLFALSIYVFVQRRLGEARNDADNQAQLEREIRELRELAMQDPLTKLPNRRVLLAALEAATARSGRRPALRSSSWI